MNGAKNNQLYLNMLIQYSLSDLDVSEIEKLIEGDYVPSKEDSEANVDYWDFMGEEQISKHGKDKFVEAIYDMIHN